MKKTFLFFAAGILLSQTAFAQEAPKDSQLALEGWQSLTFENKTPNEFSKLETGEISIKSNESVSVLFKDIDVDLSQTPKLSWNWKVTQNVPVTDLTQKGDDDRSLALYVSFPFDEENASFWEHFVRGIVVAVKGEDAPGRVINYVWGDDEEVGTVLESPYLKSAGAMIMLQKADTFGDEWITETVNIAEDYEKIFGVPAVKPFQIAISSDTDDTKVTSQGFVKDIQFIE